MYIGYVGISAHIDFCENHTHNHWEVCMNLEGDSVNYANDVPHNFSLGDIFICAPGVKHKKTASTAYFKDIYIGVMCDDYFPSDFTYGYFKDTDGSVRRILEIMHKVYNSDSPERFVTLSSLAEAIFSMLKGMTSTNHKLTPAVEQLKNEIIANFSNPEYRISDSKEYSYYNKDYMRQLFKKETGLSPLDYLSELRLKNAKKLLETERTPQYRISEISYLCGFYDVGYFTRMFRKKYGISPSEYRADFLIKLNNSSDSGCDCCNCFDFSEE